MKYLSNRISIRTILVGLFLLTGIFFTPIYFISVKAEESEIEHPNIILFIGDGMGFNQIEYGRLIEYGPDGNSSILDLQYQGSVATSNIDGIITDSAASGTAISTGVKTQNGKIGVTWDNKELKNIREIAEENGYDTGIIATCHLTHATPAAFLAHNSDRGNYLQIGADIAQADAEVLLGGGSGSNYLGNYIDELKGLGYDYVTNKSDLISSSTKPLLGLFNSANIPREQDWNAEKTEPHLSDMVKKAISLLNNSEKPYFLMVEGSQIDWAGHDNDKTYLAHEVIEFEKSVKYAKEMAELDDSILLLVTADHETGGFSIGNYAFSEPLPAEEDDLPTKITKRNNRIAEISTGFSTGSHTNSEVILAGMGPYSELILNAEHHIDTFSIMRTAIEDEQGPPSNPSGFYIPLPYLGAIIGIPVILSIILIIYKKKNQK